uniref:Potassium channel domain-containing protein n=1 Tax=Panagrolaimus sp. ES5 TaxID=591445 RepID=A0AC34GSR5_9BILA
MSAEFDSTQTWPRSVNPPKLPAEAATRAKVTAALANLKHHAKRRDSARVTELVGTLQDLLTNADPNKDSPDATAIDFSRTTMKPIREEPYFDSMILCESPKVARSRAPSRMNSISYADGIGSVLDFPVAANPVIEDPDEPVWIKIVPHVVLTLASITYLSLGAEMFRWLDPEIGKKPFHIVLLLTFQICFTIGWGNVPPTTDFTQLLCIPYSTIGIPLLFATLSQYGRFLAENYTIDWIFLSAVVRHKATVKEKKRQMPISGAFNMLVLHQFIGIILFNTVFAKLGVVKAWYFVWITTAMIGFGDIAPEPANLLSSVAMLLYFAIGNIVIQAMLICICYHIQRVHLVLLKMYLYKLHLYAVKKVNEARGTE